MELINLASNGNVVHCPYNSVHTMPHKTLAIHLTKCPDKPNLSHIFKKCMYNNLHIIHKHELEAHEENCLDRIQLDKEVYESVHSPRPNIIIEKEPTVSNEQLWDEEPGETVNICEQVNQRTNLMKPIYGLSKSKRKQLRTQLHTKCSNIDLSYNADSNIKNRQDASASASSTANDKCQTK